MMKLLPPETEKPGATLSMMPGSCRFALASSAAILFISIHAPWRKA
ncbi:MAG: hypothetical protein VZQ96_10150 [Succiniclasticum sp.]|nr:hypothetical protein [Succiniclasticum sp.]